MPYQSQALVSGTSMAAAHIAGLVAYLITLQGNVSPAKMLAKLTALSTKDALTDLRASFLSVSATISHDDFNSTQHRQSFGADYDHV